jgi:hypothetical protein
VFTHNNDANISIHILGLFGNPSDGFHGKTVSMLIGNFAAKVTLTPSKKLKIVRESDMERYSMGVFHLFLSLPLFFSMPSSKFSRFKHLFSFVTVSSLCLLYYMSILQIANESSDKTQFTSIAEHHAHVKLSGYYGGLRLIQATMAKVSHIYGVSFNLPMLVNCLSVSIMI